MTEFLELTLSGLSLGCIYALIAIGFVLVFKATQAVNFAAGSIGLVTAWFFSMLLVDWDIPGRWLPDNEYLVWFSTLAVAIAAAPDLLLLDEPTNHVSLALAGELEEALGTAPGGVVLASHDRWLRRRWTGPELTLSPWRARP